MTLRAAHVWCGPHRVWSPGYVRFDAAGRIEACGPSRGRATPWLIVPGLVNAHVHLQLPPLAGPRAFVPWLRAVIASRRIATAATDAVAHTVRALRQLLDSGCTAVGEIDSLGTSPAILRQFGVAGRCYQELLGFDVDAGQARAQFMYEATGGERVTLHVSVLAANQQSTETAFRFASDGAAQSFYWVDGRFGYALTGTQSKDKLAVLGERAYQQLTVSHSSGSKP